MHEIRWDACGLSITVCCNFIDPVNKDLELFDYWLLLSESSNFPLIKQTKLTSKFHQVQGVNNDVDKCIN